MARFYGSITGQARTEATRRGSPQSGISAHVRGWDIGVRVEGKAQDTDTFTIYATGGSNGQAPNLPIARIWRTQDGLLRLQTFASDNPA